ncbi:MAG TPA: TonB-dependent receptor, partial [Sphingobacteriaceae bacterium]|nr:TonB-dependent receptor [Sphingobacteriaceae bacterium]
MKFILTLLIVFTTFSIKAQNNSLVQNRGKINGRVVDSISRVPIAYAGVTLYQDGNDNPVNVAASDQKGNFSISNLADGNYRMVVEFLSYKKRIIDHIVIGKSTNLSLGNILLASIQTLLESVTITGKVPVIENKIDKLVYNAANDLTSQSGVATDVLKKVPQITVDIDGNVELQGSSGIRFLINGKPSSIFGSSITDALQSIPASQIKTIEVITSPGAKYDAAGTGGIINIILKNNNIQGINGAVNLSAGTRLENGSVNLNVKHGNLGLSTFFNGNSKPNTTTINSINRRSVFSDTINDLTQRGNSDVRRKGFSTGFSFDWTINKKNSLTGSVGYDFFKNANTSLTNQQIKVQKSSALITDDYSLLNSVNHSKENSLDLSLEYKKTFQKEGQELGIQITSGIGRDDLFYEQQQSDINTLVPFSGSNSKNPGKDNETEIVVDYTYPVNENLTIETGAKTIINTIESNVFMFDLNNATKEYTPNLSQSNKLDYTRNVYAYYLSGTFKLFNFLDIKSGLRYERTTANANYSQVGKIQLKPYNTFAPSFVLSHSFKNKQTLKLSYTYRIERPDYEDLNPFLDLSDPRNASTGNPDLKPEIGNNFELGFNKAYQKGTNLTIAAFYRHNGHDIKSFSTFYPSLTVGDSIYQNVTLSTRLNIGEEIQKGISISGSIPFSNKVTMRTNMFFTNQTIINKYTGGPNVNGFGYRLNLNGSYQIKQNWAAELFGNYNSSQKSIQGKRPAFFSYNLAVRKQFLNK